VVKVKLDINGKGEALIDSPIGFLNHMLSLFAFHGKFDLEIHASGDIDVDYHHLVEDVGITLGEAFRRALGKRDNIKRFGFFLMPMDDALIEVALDLVERAFFFFDVDFDKEKIGTFDVELIREFWRSFSYNAFLTLHISKRRGENAHHISEAIFKGVAKALRMALEEDKGIPSTKGMM